MFAALPSHPRVVIVAAILIGRCAFCDDVIDKAKQYLTNNYLSDCKSPTYRWPSCTYHDPKDSQITKVGFDCAGLVQYAYSLVGIPACRNWVSDVAWPIAQKTVAGMCDAKSQLPEGAGQQYFSSLVQPVKPATCGKSDHPTPQISGDCALETLVRTGALTRGDLLFFDSQGNGTVGHVGIYAGGGMMIDAFDDVLNMKPGGGIREDNLLAATHAADQSPQNPMIGDPNFWKSRFLFAGRVSAAEPIISVTGTNDQPAALNVGEQALAVSWTQSVAATDVTISASVRGGTMYTVTAYLTTQIGPGTSAANEIAQATIGFPGVPSYINTVLLRVPNLPQGTYYLTLNANSGSGCTPETVPVCSPGAWAGTPAPSVAASSGVVANGSYFTPSVPGPPVATYPPATAFKRLANPAMFLFTVSGTPAQ